MPGMNRELDLVRQQIVAAREVVADKRQRLKALGALADAEAIAAELEAAVETLRALKQRRDRLKRNRSNFKKR